MRVVGRELQAQIYRRFPDLAVEHHRSVQFGKPRIHFVPVTDRNTRSAFDFALDTVHYARSCQRVGRCLRLCVYEGDVWVGGIVLGSTFPNIEVRDSELGLKKHVRDVARRGLNNPWSRGNRDYWQALQHVVNHARTFIFPRFQGHGLGIAAHRELLRSGLRHWERRYQERVAALDTLCTHSDSKLFSKNGWTLVGNTKGYTSDPAHVFSTPAFVNEWKGIRHNVALKRIAPGEDRWWVWTIVTDPTAFREMPQSEPRRRTPKSKEGRPWRRAIALR